MKKFLIINIVFICCMLPFQKSFSDNFQLIDQKIATIGALDKITGRVKKIDIPVGAADRFFSLDIYVKSCQTNPPNQMPEHAAYVEIVERLGQNKLRRKLFQGWMYASSPALSAMDHPVYDVWVVECKTPPKEPEKKK